MCAAVIFDRAAAGKHKLRFRRGLCDLELHGFGQHSGFRVRFVGRLDRDGIGPDVGLGRGFRCVVAAVDRVFDLIRIRLCVLHGCGNRVRRAVMLKGSRAGHLDGRIFGKRADREDQHEQDRSQDRCDNSFHIPETSLFVIIQIPTGKPLPGISVYTIPHGKRCRCNKVVIFFRKNYTLLSSKSIRTSVRVGVSLVSFTPAAANMRLLARVIGVFAYLSERYTTSRIPH